MYSKSYSFGRPLSPGHCRRKNALPVSYYALFEGWLLLHLCSLNLNIDLVKNFPDIYKNVSANYLKLEILNS